ncbi:MAG TPA: hypothetical protein VKT24_05120 [Rhizomicrobium sp.]|nr:hypothetical protein [Rhizomicrobium sp.]
MAPRQMADFPGRRRLASAVGDIDVWFSRKVFKWWMGMPPTEYRARSAAHSLG